MGSSGRGTGKNLAPAATVAKDQLNTILEKVNAVNPPPLLALFHRDMKKLIGLRLGAYDATISGWKLEQDGSDFRGHYDGAQDKYQLANEIIVSLNGQMEKILKAALQTAPS